MKTINKFMMSLLMLICVSIGISPQVIGQTGSFTYSASGPGTFVVPPGVTGFTLKLWGAGGGGGNTPGTEGQGGGGGGAFQVIGVINQLPGWTYPYIVGAGGTAGNAGGTTSMDAGFSAAGGSGSNSGNGFGGLGGVQAPLGVGGNVASSAAWNGGNGGASTNPQQTSFGGGGGGRADNGNNGGNGTNGGTSGSGAPGVGGSVGGGAGGNTGGVGGNATSYGGGGGGRGFNGATSGTGGDGRIEVSWTCPTLTSISYVSPTVCSYSSALTPTIVPSTGTGGTYSSSTLTGFLNTTTGAIAPGAPQGTHVITYGWPAFGGCPAASVSFTLTIAPQAVVTAFSYAGSPYCTNTGIVSPTFIATGVAGTFTSTAGLSLNANNGAINTGASTPGTYTVTYTVAANGNCNAVTATASVTITALPTISNFDYPPPGPGNSSYCAGAGIQTPTSTVTNPNNNAISYSASPAGLTINASTGAVNPATSTPGTYTVTMTIAAGGGCSAVTATTSVTILARPTATIAYTGNPFCQTVASTPQAVTITGITGGPLTVVNWTATPAGLTINPATGEINLNSTPGTYSVKYRFTGLNGCLDSSSTTVTIKPRPTSTITYAAGTNPVCSNVSPVLSGNVVAVGPWTLTLSNGQTVSGTGAAPATVPWSITVNTLDPGETETYTVTSLVDINCSGVANPDMPGSVTITKRTTTSGVIPNAASIKVCKNQDASVNVILTSPANNCAPNPQFSGVFRIERWNGLTWVFQTNYSWTLSPGPSTTGIAAAITIPASLLPNTTSSTILYRVAWVSLTDCNGCTATPLTGTQVLEVVPVPLLTVSAAPTTDVCPGANIMFTVNQAPGSSIVGAMFNWVATDAQGNVLGSADNVSFGTNAINTNLGLACPYNNVVTFTITPLNPNCCNCLGIPITRVVTVRDIVAPTWTTVANNLNRTLECSDASGIANAQLLFPVATDNCDNDVSNIVKISGAFVASQACPQSGSYTNRWTVTDECGNTSLVFTQVITILDRTAPTLSGVLPLGATNMNLCFSAIPVGPTAAAIAALYTDNCAPANSITATKTGAPTGNNCNWSVTYTYVISDPCGNTTTTAITYSGGDRTAPTLTGVLPLGATNMNLCFSAIPVGPTAAAIAALYTDNCSGNTVSATKSGTPTGNNCNWSVTYTYVISDNCGNSTTTAITYSGGDRTAPTLTGVLPLGATNMNLCFSAIPVGPTAAEIAALYTDNCSGNTVSATKSGTPTGTNCAWSVTYTYVISDNCGNTTTTAITYSGGDRTAPSLTGVLPLGATNMNLCFSAIPVGPTAAAIAALYTDNCSGNTVSATKSGTPTGNNCNWSVTYTYVISDNCGNSTTTAITYSGGDRTAPTLSGVLPLGQTNINGCIGSAPTGPTAAEINALYSDNCGGAVTTTRTGAPTGNNCAWSVTYVYVISDACGNTTTTSITHSGSDRTAPLFAGTIPTQTLNTGAGANCGVPMPDYRSLVSVSDCNGTVANGGITLTQLAPNAPGTMVFGFNGQRDIVIMATDGCGNTSTTTFVVDLKDLTAPVANCKPFTLVLNASGTGTITVANVNNGSFDNCTPTAQLVYSLSQTNFTCANVGTQNTVTLTVTDLCGNTSTCTSTVTVVDNTKPTITCLGDMTINKDANCTYTLTDLTSRGTAADACGVVVTQSLPVGTIFGASITSMPITLTATDPSGNTATCTFTINFLDVTPPVFANCPSNITVFTGANNSACSQTATWTPPTATDACIVCCITQPVTSTHVPGATFALGVTTVTYTAVDASGNSSTCSFTVTVVDNTRPILTGCPANISVTTGAGRTTCDQTATWTEPTATDNCTATANLVRTRSHAPGATFPVGVTTVTYMFTDAAGNTSTTCSFTVTVTDNTKPTLTCPGDITTVPNAAGCVANVVNPNPTFSDNCGVVNLSWTITGVTTASSATTPNAIRYVGTRTFNVGTSVVTYTATDAAGNTQTCSYNVIVNKPLLGVIAGTSTVLQNVNTTSTVSFTASGGVAPYTFVYTAPAGGFPSAGSHTITTTVSNSSTVGGNPNHLITTVPQSNATPGVYTYTLVSVTDALGCVVTPGTTATVTILAFNHPAPDLAPNVVTQGSVNIPLGQTREGYIQVTNVRANPTTGFVELEVYTPANFNLTINPTTTLANGQAVQNNDFDITFYPGLGYAIKTKPGVILGANSNLKIGYTLTATGTNLTTGQYIVNIANQTGGIGITVGDDNNGNNRTLKTFKVVN